MNLELVLSPKKEKENHKEYAYRLLRDNIMTLHILPGTMINEGELSELLNISRTPVHEAVMKLKDEMLVDVFPQRGSQVSRLDTKAFREGLFLRLTVEPAILIRITGHVHSGYLDRLRENLEQQSQIVEQAWEWEKKIKEFLKTDDQFHRIIYEAAQMPHIWAAVRSVNSHYDRIRYMDALVNRVDLEKLHQHHKRIFYYLLMGGMSEEEVRQFYAAHLSGYEKNLHHILETYAEYFTQI